MMHPIPNCTGRAPPWHIERLRMLFASVIVTITTAQGMSSDQIGFTYAASVPVLSGVRRGQRGSCWDTVVPVRRPRVHRRNGSGFGAPTRRGCLWTPTLRSPQSARRVPAWWM